MPDYRIKLISEKELYIDDTFSFPEIASIKKYLETYKKMIGLTSYIATVYDNDVKCCQIKG